MAHSTSPLNSASSPEPRAPKAAWWWFPYLTGWGVFLAVEWHSAASHSDRRTPVDWLLGTDFDVLVYLAFLLIAPIAWWIHGNPLSTRRWSFETLTKGFGAWLGPIGQEMGEQRPIEGRSLISRLRPALLSLVVGTISLAASLAAGSHFDDLPPAYHDEYSYLFQARTFLAGRVSYPSHVAARLFDQMHVLNEGKVASRYFPGAGLWMAPFVAAGHPYWGHWLAGAICSILTFWIGRELAGDAGGLIAGLLTALSPGMALFSNLLLAHHPTLVGLGVFLLGFLRMVRSASWKWGLVSGTGLAFAMICRPMTAAGVALPFGVWFLARGLRLFFVRRTGGSSLLKKGTVPLGNVDLPLKIHPLERDSPLFQQAGRHRFEENWSPLVRVLVSSAAALILPLAVALAGLFLYDKAITGDGWLTPYSLYTDLHTPSHVYGFNNVERGRQHLGPRVIENYDKWAENLTPARAMANALTRWTASWQWTLGLLPQTLALCGGLVLWRRLSTGTWLVLGAIVSLHAVHVPYWFAGMEDHHYVFESGPLWTIWIAVATIEAGCAWYSTGHRAMCVWWASLLTAAVLMNWTTSGGKWSAPLDQGINRVAFARHKHGRFASLVRQRAIPGPALVLVDADPADRHIDYVANRPDLSAPVLIGHYLPDLVPVSEIKRLFPDRKLYLYRVREDEWQSLQ